MSTLQKYYLKNKIINSNIKIVIITMIITSLLLVLWSLLVGVYDISLGDLVNVLAGRNDDIVLRNIIVHSRLPRALTAYFTGCLLALSGILIQINLNNSLASSTTIGVNSGAALFIVLFVFLFPSLAMYRTVFAFIGALLTSLIVYSIAYRSGASRIKIILAGLAISSLYTSIINTITLVDPNVLIDKNMFYIGGFSYSTVNQVIFLGVCLVIVATVTYLICNQISLLVLGDDIANSLGVNVNRLRFVSIILSSAAAAAAVSVAGLISFVGLIVPNIVRYFYSNDIRKIIPITVILGGILVLVSDTISRIIFMPYEVPSGIILSFFGSALFLVLLIMQGMGRGSNDFSK